MKDYDKLIERLHKEAYGSDIEELLLESATALSTLQAGNEKLRAELEQVKRIPQKRQKKRPCMKMTPFMRKRNVNP